MQPAQPQPAIPRSMQFALFVTGCLWLFAARTAASHAAQSVANRLNLPLLDPPLKQSLLLFLLLAGFSMLHWISTRYGGLRLTNALPRRPTSPEEFLRGAALGWAMLLVTVLPLMLSGDLFPHFYPTLPGFGQATVALFTLAIGTLALEVAFRGYLYKRLIVAIGTIPATVVLALIYALFVSFRPNSTSISFAVTFLAGILFSVAYLRTHALWLGWGLHFAWDVAMGVLLGLPVAGYATYASVVQTGVGGSDWFSGGSYGPEGSIVTAVVLIAVVPLLYRITREYAWNYTHPPILSAGHPVIIAPPAAHLAMEEAASTAAVPLVQILGTTSTNASTLPVIDEHLRRPGD